MGLLPLGGYQNENGCPRVPTSHYLSGCCQQSSSDRSPQVLLLDYNFITANKCQLESSAIIAKNTYKSIKKEFQFNKSQRKCILDYLTKSFRGKREIISFENKIDEVLILSSQLSPETKKFISDFFSGCGNLSCSTYTKQELIQYTRKIREILKDELLYERKKGRSQSLYPITRCTENNLKSIEESYSKIPNTLDLSTQFALTSPLRAYRELVCDYHRFTGAVSALTNVFTDPSIKICA